MSRNLLAAAGPTEMVDYRRNFSSGVTYSLVFVNNSNNTGNACVYQKDPTITDPTVMSLAWFAKYATPQTKIVFTWQISYDFVWSQTGQLVPGVLFVASQTFAANLSTTNQITLDYIGQAPHGAFNFTNQGKGAQDGSLYITESSAVPPQTASVGIGMSGFGTFVQQAQSNWNLIFTPHPEYWITFGNYTQGEVLNITSISNAARIAFPPNVYSMTATLNQDNTWTVGPTDKFNAALIAGQEGVQAYGASQVSSGWGSH